MKSTSNRRAGKSGLGTELISAWHYDARVRYGVCGTRWPATWFLSTCNLLVLVIRDCITWFTSCRYIPLCFYFIYIYVNEIRLISNKYTHILESFSYCRFASLIIIFPGRLIWHYLALFLLFALLFTVLAIEAVTRKMFTVTFIASVNFFNGKFHRVLEFSCNAWKICSHPVLFPLFLLIYINCDLMLNS